MKCTINFSFPCFSSQLFLLDSPAILSSEMNFLTGLSHFLFAPKSTPSPSQRLGTASAATHIPEILEEIFSYLSQYDIQHRTSAVNHLWRVISEDLIQAELHWNDTFSPQDCHKRLARTGCRQVKTFHCLALDRRTFPAFHKGVEQDVEDAWACLHQALSILARSTETNSTDMDGSEATSKSWVLSWRKIVFEGWNCFNRRWDPLLWHCRERFQGVVSLHLLHLTPGCIDLSCIFQALSNLEELVIEASQSLPLTFKRNTSITWKDREQELDHRQDQDHNHEYQHPLQFQKLRTLAFRHIIMRQSTLQTILSAMPHLQSLELVSMIANTEGAEVSIDRHSLVDCLSRQCPYLTHFHFSITGSVLSLEDSHQILASFPRITSMSLTGSLVPGTLNLYVDRLTTLTWEIPQSSNNIQHGNMLHAYMCQSPLLLHLKAYRVWFLQDHFFLGGRSNSVTGEPIWACRNLRTLHLQIEPQGRPTATEQGAGSRSIFGYLSKVCPRLQDVAIERINLNVDILSGLLLMSKCRSLRRLKLYTASESLVKERDIEWMCLGMMHNNSTRRIQDGKKNRHRGQHSLIGAVTGAVLSGQWTGLSAAPLGKSTRESRVMSTIDALKRLAAAEDATITPTLVSHSMPRGFDLKQDPESNNDDIEELDPREVAHNCIRQLVQQLQTLVRRSTLTSRDESRVCCWPDLEVFEIHQLIHGSTPVEKSKELIHRLRPDLQHHTV